MSKYEIRASKDGGFELFIDGTPQSWINLDDPTDLPYEYMSLISAGINEILERDLGQRLRVIHIGGGALSLPRYIAAKRPQTAQIVLEPNSEMLAEVRLKLPLPKHSGIKVREELGEVGIAKMPDNYADLVILDAFVGSQVPGALVTDEVFARMATLLRPQGQLWLNLTDYAPFSWTRTVLRTAQSYFPKGLLIMDTATWKGRRSGNLVVGLSRNSLDPAHITQIIRYFGQPYKIIAESELKKWFGKGDIFTATKTESSPARKGWFQ